MSGWTEEPHPRKPDGEFAKKGGSNWVGGFLQIEAELVSQARP